ncbi:hypothetical protein [Pedobacter hartonius]|uniref:Uncharacterized protein n=1 Tax=Pedobacter hartonius TaxID=425514 RepID=A0A1H4GA74_9SPHI|nr:hypothetical protein [Pedobacter hartonius]SEB05602.1 hypothetical protein SAMN05443550_10996 [Pedobacter hartonius]
MKFILSAFLIVTVLVSCQNKETEKIYSPRSLATQEDLNQFEKGDENALTIVKHTAEDAGADSAEIFGVKFRDTTINIQTGASDRNAATGKFALAEFLNSQKTSLLVQIADQSGLTAPFYIISIKNGKLDVVSIYRPSSGKEDKRFTKGLSRIGRSGYLINNDFFISTVNVKVYPIRRQHPHERIQGLHFINSADKKTLVFLVSSSLYQVNYPTGEVYTQPLSSKMPKNAAEVFSWIQKNYSWQTDAKGVSFLRKNKDDNRIIDIREFKKS